MSRDTTRTGALARYAIFFSLSLAAHLVVCLGGERAAAQDLVRRARTAVEGGERAATPPAEARRP